MTVKLKCPVCGSTGTLMQKTTKTKTTTGQYKAYRYWYVYHGKKAKKPWCYLGKEDLEKTEIKKAIEELTTQTATQTDTVTTQTKNNLKSSSIQQNNQTQVENLYSNVLLPNVLKICVSLNSMEGPGGSDR